MLVGDLWAFALRGDNADVRASWWLVIAANPQWGKKAAKLAQANDKPKQPAPASVYCRCPMCSCKEFFSSVVQALHTNA